MEFNRETYREYDAINYSKLSTLQKNPSDVVDDRDTWNDGMAFGSIVDILCFEPELFDKQFYVSSANREPSGTAKKLADWILENVTGLKIGSLGSVISEEWQNQSWGLSDLLDKAEEAVGSSTNFQKYGGLDYLKEQIESKNKHVVSQELVLKAKAARNTLLTHKFTKKYFTEQDNTYELKFQVPILWSLKDHGIDELGKCLLDIVLIDHEEKKVYPIDLKTTSRSALGFESQVLKWSYYLQASYYYYAMKFVAEKDKSYTDYTVQPFKFIVLSQKDINRPYIYNTTEEELVCGKDGGYINRWDTEVRGWKQLIKDLQWHIKNNKWNYSREVYENNGEVELNIFG